MQFKFINYFITCWS